MKTQMIAFYKEYSDPSTILQPPVAKLPGTEISLPIIDLKKGKFKPEYAGKLNFYCNVVNDRLKHASDQPTIGLILCQENSRLLAEYSFVGIDKPIGISTYELTRALPKSMQSALPTVEEIEAELGELAKPKQGAGGKKKGGGR